MLIVLSVLLMVTSVAGAAGTRSTAKQAAVRQGVTLEVANQTTYVVADGVFEVELKWTGARNPDLFVSATIFAPVEDQDRLEAEPSEPRNRYPSTATPITVIDLPVADNGNLVFSIPIRSFNEAESERIWLDVPGVYPVTIEIRSAGGPVASVRTNLIRLPTETLEIPLAPVSLLLNISVADGLVLDDAVDILERHPSLAMTVVLEDGVLSQLASDTDMAGRFRLALGDRAITAIPALGLDPSAIASIDRPDLYRAAIAETAFRFESVGLEYNETLVALETSVTDAGAALLTSLGIDTIVQVGPTAGSGTISTSDYRTADADRLTVVQSDDARMVELQSEAFTGAVAHDFLAALTVRFQSDQTPIMLGGPELRLVRIETLEVLLDALDQPGPIQALSLRRAAREAPLVPFWPAGSPLQDLSADAPQLATAQTLLDTYEGFYQSGGTAPISFATQVLSSLSRNRNSLDRAADIARVIDDLNSALDVISLPENQSITLAARERAIPLSISNDSSGDRNVLLRFDSDRIEVAQHDQIVTVPAGTSAIEIDVEARSLGVSPLEVEVLSPDGRQQLATIRFQVRSTAIPGLGYLISGAALIFLLAWWIVSASKAKAISAHPASRVAVSDDSDDGNGGVLIAAGKGRDPSHNRRASDRMTNAGRGPDQSSDSGR